MPQPNALISRRVRTAARDRMVGWTLAEITDVFHDEGFSADLTYQLDVSGERRGLVEQFYRSVNWSDWDDCRGVLRVFEALIDAAVTRDQFNPMDGHLEWRDQFLQLLARDGFEPDDIGRLRARWESVTAASVAGLPAESSIPVLLRRMWDNVDEHPDAAIGAAKEAIEATAKHVLTEAGETLTGRESVPDLVARTQKTLDVHSSTVAPTKKGADTIKRTLAGLSQAALGVNDLRNDYGSGHGRPTRATGLSPRHARLAAQSADGWVRFMLDTNAARVAAAPAPVAVTA